MMNLRRRVVGLRSAYRSEYRLQRFSAALSCPSIASDTYSDSVPIAGYGSVDCDSPTSSTVGLRMRDRYIAQRQKQYAAGAQQIHKRIIERKCAVVVPAQVDYLLMQLKKLLFDHPQTQRLFNTILAASINAEDHVVTEKLIAAFNESTLNLNAHICATLMKYYAIKGNLDQAIAVLGKARGKFEPNAMTCGSVLFSALRSPEPQRYVFEFMTLMRSLGCKPSSSSLTQALIEWCDRHNTAVEKYQKSSRFDTLASKFSSESGDSVVNRGLPPELCASDDIFCFYELVKFDVLPQYRLFQCLLDCFFAEQRADLAVATLDHMLSQNFYVGVEAYNNLLKLCVDSDDYNRALQVVGLMQREGVSGNERTFSNLLACAANSGAHKDALKTLGIMMKQGYAPSRHCFASVFIAAIKHRDEAQLLKLWEMMGCKEHDLNKTDAFLAIVYDGRYSAVPDDYIFEAPLEFALSHGVMATDEVVAALTRCMRTKTHADRILKLIESSFESGVMSDVSQSTYHSLIQRCIVYGHEDNALAFNSYLLERNCKPFDKTTRLLLNYLADKAEKDIVRSAQVVSDAVTHKVYVFTQSEIQRIVEMASEPHHLEVILGMFTAMKSIKFKANLRTYSLLISTLRSVLSDSEVMSIYQFMRNDGVPPSKQLLDEILHVSNGIGGSSLLDILKEYQMFGFKPPMEAFNLLMLRMKEDGNYARQAQVVYETMLKQRGVPDFQVLKTFVSAALEKDEDTPYLTNTMRLLMDAIRDNKLIDSSTADQAVLRFGQRGELNRSVALVRTLQKHGIRIKEQTYAWLISACRMCKNIDQAFSLYDDVLSSGVAPGTYMCSTLMFHCLDHGRVDLAFELVSSMPQMHHISAATLFKLCIKKSEGIPEAIEVTKSLVSLALSTVTEDMKKASMVSEFLHLRAKACMKVSKSVDMCEIAQVFAEFRKLDGISDAEKKHMTLSNEAWNFLLVDLHRLQLPALLSFVSSEIIKQEVKVEFSTLEALLNSKESLDWDGKDEFVEVIAMPQLIDQLKLSGITTLVSSDPEEEEIARKMLENGDEVLQAVIDEDGTLIKFDTEDLDDEFALPIALDTALLDDFKAGNTSRTQGGKFSFLMSRR